MIKRISALTLTAMLFIVFTFASVITTVVPAQASGETTTYTIYNTADGTTDNVVDKGTYEHKDGYYEDVRFYKNDNKGTNSTGTNQKNLVGSRIQVGLDSNGDWASFLRFPLPQIKANEVVAKAELALVTAYNTTHTGSWNLNVYKDFTDVVFGTQLTGGSDGNTYTKTFSEFTASDKLVHSTPVALNAATQFTKINVDVTDYVSGLIVDKAASADICLAAPGADQILALCSGSMKSTSGANYKPRLIITTEVDPTYGLPAIDSVENEGKTKIRMQTQKPVEFTNDSCGIVFGNGTNVSYDINCKTAGKYYLGVYSATKTPDPTQPTRPGKLIVNGTETSKNFATNCISAYGDTVVPSTVANNLYLNVFEVDLVEGKNTIEIKIASSHLGFAYVELTNYARADVTAENKNISEKGIEILAANQPDPTVATLPTVVYKVYDSLADVPTTAVNGNITMQLSGEGDAIYSAAFIAASFDSSNCLKEVNLIRLPVGTKATRNVDMGSFNLSDVEYINLYALDGTTLVPITTTIGTIN